MIQLTYVVPKLAYTADDPSQFPYSGTEPGVSGTTMQTGDPQQVPLLMGNALQTYQTYNVPVIMGAALQTVGGVVVTNYLISFNVVDVAVPSYTYYGIDFNVIPGVFNQYSVDFYVAQQHKNEYPVSFDVVAKNEYLVDFNVVAPTFNRYSVTFDVTGPKYNNHPISFTVVENKPPNLYPVEFSVVSRVTKATTVNFYVNSGTTSEGFKTTLSKVPGGGGTRGVYSLTFRVYQGDRYVASSDASIRVNTGEGIQAELLNIPQIATGTQLIEVYNKGSVIKSVSGTYQQFMGVRVI